MSTSPNPKSLTPHQLRKIHELVNGIVGAATMQTGNWRQRIDKYEDELAAMQPLSASDGRGEIASAGDKQVGTLCDTIGHNFKRYTWGHYYELLDNCSRCGASYD